MDPIIIDFSIIINKGRQQINNSIIEEDFSKGIIESSNQFNNDKNKEQESNETVSIGSNIFDNNIDNIERSRKLRKSISQSKKYTSYPESLRLQVRRALKTLKPPEVALKYNINIITLRRWIKEKFVRKERQGERCITNQIKQPLLKWINKKGIINLTKKEIREKAMSLCKNKEFKASHRWYQAFMKKCNLKKPKIARLELEKLNSKNKNNERNNDEDDDEEEEEEDDYDDDYENENEGEEDEDNSCNNDDSN